MKTCLSFQDILAGSRPQIAEMQQVGNSFPDASTPGAGAACARQVGLVQGVVVHTYGVAAALAKKAEDLEEASDVWNQMSRFCHAALQILADLKNKYPQCGAPELYDLILDYKLAADKRYKNTLEEIACQKMEFPAASFPKPN